MTIKEAIEVLEQDLFSEYCTDLKEALTMAIKSLEAWSGLREEMVNMKNNPLFEMVSRRTLHEVALSIIDKHLSEVEHETDN